MPVTATAILYRRFHQRVGTICQGKKGLVMPVRRAISLLGPFIYREERHSFDLTVAEAAHHFRQYRRQIAAASLACRFGEAFRRSAASFLDFSIAFP